MAIDNSFGLTPQAIATIYHYDSGPLGHLTEVDGPCFVTSQISQLEGSSPQAPTQCDSGFVTPKTLYAYYGSGVGTKSNKLQTKLACTVPGCNITANPPTGGLATQYTAYDERGHATTVIDANNVTTTSTYQGSRLVTQQVGTDTTTYGYDGDFIQYVRHPSGLVDFFCHRSNQSSASCSGSLSKHVYWKAQCADTACATQFAKVVYTYAGGYATSELYYPGQITTLDESRAAYHDRDPRGRPTFDSVGAGFSRPSNVVRMFDSDGNPIAEGEPYNNASQFCNQGVDPNCSQMQYDGLDRLVQLVEPGGSGGTSSFTHDSLNNVTSITYGCGSGSSCRTVTYGYDDFGNVLSISAPWASGSSPQFKYSYDAQGHIVFKHSASMASTEYLRVRLRHVGRPLDLKHPSGGETLWSFDYDSSNTTDSTCPTPGAASFTNGRVQVRHDSFGETWYVYNFRGQVTNEVRVRANHTGCVYTAGAGAPWHRRARVATRST